MRGIEIGLGGRTDWVSPIGEGRPATLFYRSGRVDLQGLAQEPAPGRSYLSYGGHSLIGMVGHGGEFIEITRSTIAEGQPFRLHLRQAESETVTIDLVVGGPDQPVGQLHGQLRLSDVGPASRMLASLLGGVAATFGEPPTVTPAQERIDRLREKHPNAYLPWTAEDDRRLRDLHQREVSIAELASTFGRQPSAIKSRLAKVLLPEA
jgi:hypothetical protein